MVGVMKWLHVVALGVWLGAIVFFSFVVAPQVFATLPRGEAGRVVSAIFPAYYFVGYACGALLLISALGLRARAPSATRAWTVAAAVAGLTLGVTLYAGVIVQPRAHALRASLHDAAEGSAVKAEFDQLHRRAVQLNGSALIGVLILSGLTAGRLRP